MGFPTRSVWPEKMARGLEILDSGSRGIVLHK